jgi:CheY-like chemotaxis protein
MASRVLLVDPDPVSRKLRSRLLNENGYAVFPARNSEDAISRVKPGAYDAVLIAGDEPKALEFCEAVRRSHPEQVVIIIADPWAYIPQQSCPDEVLRGGGPEGILRTVNSVLHGSGTDGPRHL